MILAAGLGTRMRPLTSYRAKPALSVRGRPVISLLLELLARHGVGEVLVNLHALPDTIRQAVERDHPESLQVTWSEESEPLGTGGGLRRAARFLEQTSDCLVIAGDMLLDLDLGALLEDHRASDRDVTLVLRDDPRADAFGSIGFDASGRVVRIGRRAIGDAKESGRGLFTSVRFFKASALANWPCVEEVAFEDLRDWLAPRAEAGEIRLGTEVVSAEDSVWEPVGTPAEYLDVNLRPPKLPSLGGSAERWGGEVETDGTCVIARSATVARGAHLERCVVWEDEVIPPHFDGRDGVYADGTFHPCLPEAAALCAESPSNFEPVVEAAPPQPNGSAP